MYKIQGSDNKEYGPVTAEMIRQWIAERRLNQQSLARAEADGVWKPLGQFPEFADAFPAAVARAAPSAPGAAPQAYAAGLAAADPQMAKAAAIARVRPAGIAMIVVSALGLAMMVFASAQMIIAPDEFRRGLVEGMKQNPNANLSVDQLMGIVKLFLFSGIGWHAVTLAASVQMVRMRARVFSIVAASMMLVPCFYSLCCLAALPIGVWALIALTRAETIAGYAAAREEG